jgi:multidrug efflux system membrane fusion protein
MPRAVAVAALLLAAASAPACPASAETARATSVTALRSEARPFEDRLILRGVTEADRRVEIQSEIAGLVASEPIRKGAVVAAGDRLCAIDPGERPANLAEAQANLRKAETDFAAAERLSERGFTAETEARSRGAALEAARAALMRAELDMRRLTIVAPFAGVLEDDGAELGALLQPGALCATLIALDPIVLVGFAPERDVARLAVGAPAEGRLVTGDRVAGAIRFVARSADPETRTFRVEVEVPNADLAVRDGMSVEIAVALEADAAHFLPQSALTLDDEGALGVRIVEDGAARFVPAAILRDSPGGVWLSGLPPRADVIVIGQEFVTDGSPVTVSYADPAPAELGQ